MFPDGLHDFLLASVGASASFIGLLFVALTVVLQRVSNQKTVAVRDRVLAESSYTALVTIFFISFVGLIPHASENWILFVFGISGSAQSLHRVISYQRTKSHQDNKAIVGAFGIVYAGIAAYGIYLLFHASATINLSIFYAIIFSLYAIALGRAWALTGLDED